jgi:type III pantothenate kinase
VFRAVADLGNTRLKWARVGDSGALVDKASLPLDPPAWAEAWAQLQGPSGTGESSWAISTVNPPVASLFAAFLESQGARSVTWFDTASQVPVAYDVEGADTGGADRALAVAGAVRLMPAGRPGLVIMCGTAITVERIDAKGVWQGGAIAPGLGTSARALHILTAQLPLVDLRRVDLENPPAAWGKATVPSLEAGVFWGTVGAVRELIARQTDDLGDEPWVIWTGGDSEVLSRFVSGPMARCEQDLVLSALKHLVFPQ